MNLKNIYCILLLFISSFVMRSKAARPFSMYLHGGGYARGFGKRSVADDIFKVKNLNFF